MRARLADLFPLELLVLAEGLVVALMVVGVSVLESSTKILDRERRIAFSAWGVEVAVEWDHPDLDGPLWDLLLPIWCNRSELAPETVFKIATEKCGNISINGEGRFPERGKYLVETVERRLHMHLATHARDAVYVHAGVVKYNEQLLVIPGRSYSGKSTLVRAFLRLGACFYSDEYAIIDSHGLVHPFPRPISLRTKEGVTRRIPAPNKDEQPLPSSRAALIVLTSFDSEGVWLPTSVSQGEAVLSMLDNTVSARLQPGLALECLTRAVEGADCWRSVRGEAEKSALAIMETLGRRRAGRGRGRHLSTPSRSPKTRR